MEPAARVVADFKRVRLCIAPDFISGAVRFLPIDSRTCALVLSRAEYGAARVQQFVNVSARVDIVHMLIAVGGVTIENALEESKFYI